jgi:hypothetical protein
MVNGSGKMFHIAVPAVGKSIQVVTVIFLLQDWILKRRAN